MPSGLPGAVTSTSTLVAKSLDLAGHARRPRRRPSRSCRRWPARRRGRRRRPAAARSVLLPKLKVTVGALVGLELLAEPGEDVGERGGGQDGELPAVVRPGVPAPSPPPAAQAVRASSERERQRERTSGEWSCAECAAPAARNVSPRAAGADSSADAKPCSARIAWPSSPSTKSMNSWPSSGSAARRRAARWTGRLTRSLGPRQLDGLHGVAGRRGLGGEHQARVHGAVDDRVLIVAAESAPTTGSHLDARRSRAPAAPAGRRPR